MWHIITGIEGGLPYKCYTLEVEVCKDSSAQRPSAEGLYWEATTANPGVVTIPSSDLTCVWLVIGAMNEDVEFFTPLGLDKQTHYGRARILVPTVMDFVKGSEEVWIPSISVGAARTLSPDVLVTYDQALDLAKGPVLWLGRMAFGGTELPHLPRYVGPVLVEVTAAESAPHKPWYTFMPYQLTGDVTMQYTSTDDQVYAHGM